jgi:hypothetical protein
MNIEHPLLALKDGGAEMGFATMVSDIVMEADGIQDCQEDLFRRETPWVLSKEVLSCRSQRRFCQKISFTKHREVFRAGLGTRSFGID